MNKTFTPNPYMDIDAFQQCRHHYSKRDATTLSGITKIFCYRQVRMSNKLLKITSSTLSMHQA